MFKIFLGREKARIIPPVYNPQPKGATMKYSFHKTAVLLVPMLAIGLTGCMTSTTLKRSVDVSVGGIEYKYICSIEHNKSIKIRADILKLAKEVIQGQPNATQGSLNDGEKSEDYSKLSGLAEQLINLCLGLPLHSVSETN